MERESSATLFRFGGSAKIEWTTPATGDFLITQHKPGIVFYLDGKEAVRLAADRKVIVAPDMGYEGAARAFWKAVAIYAPPEWKVEVGE